MTKEIIDTSMKPFRYSSEYPQWDGMQFVDEEGNSYNTNLYEIGTYEYFFDGYFDIPDGIELCDYTAEKAHEYAVEILADSDTDSFKDWLKEAKRARANMYK